MGTQEDNIEHGTGIHLSFLWARKMYIYPLIPITFWHRVASTYINSWHFWLAGVWSLENALS